MSLTATTSEHGRKAYDEAQENRSFAVLPDGDYPVTVAKATVVPFAKDGAYAKRSALNVQLNVEESARVKGSTSIVFLRVPLFDTFLPSEKSPNGSPAYGYFQFFEAVGVPKEQIDAGQLPDLGYYGGKPLTARIEVRKNLRTDKDENNVRWVNKRETNPNAGSVAAANPDIWSNSGTSAPAEQPWATPQSDRELQEATAGGKGVF